MQSALVLAALAFWLAAPAGADSIGVTAAVNAGGLSLVKRFVGKSRASLVVLDARGSGAGWTLTMPAGEVVTVQVGCAHGSTCTLPRIEARTAGTVIAAKPGSGMGSIAVVVSFRPVNASPVFRLRGQ